MKTCSVKYKERQAESKDFQTIFNIKKEALHKYVNEIWGWNETDQIRFLENSFNEENFTIIEVNKLPIGILEIVEKENCIDLLNIDSKFAYRKF